MEHICEESAAGWAGSLSLRRETSGAWRSAEQLAIRRPVLSVWKRVDEWIDDTRSPGQDGSHHVNDGHFCLFLLFENLKKAIDHNQFEREWWGCCTRIRDYISHYEWKKKQVQTSSSATLTTIRGRKQRRKQQKMMSIMRVRRRSSRLWCFSDELFLLLLFFTDLITGRLASSCLVFPLVPGLWIW